MVKTQKAEGKPAVPAATKPNSKKAAKPEKGDATEKETKPTASWDLVGYVKAVKMRHNLPGQILEKLRKCQTKGEAKRELRAYLQSGT